MGANSLRPAEESEPESYSDKTEQTDVTPSSQSCIDVVEELKSARPSGEPLMSNVAPELNPDLSQFLFKQDNERYSNPDEATDPESWRLGDMRPGIYGQRSGMLDSHESDTADDASLVAKPDYFEDMKEVFGGSKYFDIVRNHNQVLSTPGDATWTQLMDGHGDEHGDGHSHGYDERQLQAATAAIQEKPDTPTTLLNFDSHSDMWLGAVAEGDENIAQWVNGVLRENPNVDEIYWVIPKDFQQNDQWREAYFEQSGVSDPSTGDRVFVHTQPDSTLYFNKETAELSGKKPEDYSEEKYRTVEFHKRTLDELPDLEGKRTALSIDLDFFDNRGFDTAYDASVDFKGEDGFRELVGTLKDRNIRPDYTTISASPEYVRTEHMRDLLRFSSLVSESIDGATDGIVVPAENIINGGRPHDGMRVDRVGIPAMELTHELFEIDARTKSPNDAIDLRRQSDELDAALEATAKVYQTANREESMKALQALDAMDGNANGIVEFEAMEALLQRVCRVTEEPMRLVKNPGVPRTESADAEEE